MKRSLFALALLAALPFAASAAEGVSYNYVRGGYVASSNNDGAPDADGFGIDASLAVHPNFHIVGGYANQELDDIGIDFDQWRLGVGYNYELSPKADLVTLIAYEKLNADGDADVTGYSAEVGVRGSLASQFEGYAFAGYADYEDLEGDFYGRLGANVKFNDTWGLNGDVKFADGDTQWFVGPRLTW
jgi:Ax21 family sulfation-dependent quorum factor